MIRAGLLALLFAALPAVRAEFLRLEFKVGGLDCASCAQTVTSRLGRMRGVDSVSLKQDTVEVTLKPGNNVKPANVAAALQQIGYTVSSTTGQAAGELSREGAGWILKVEPAGLAFSLRPASGLALKAGNVKVSGAILPPPDPSALFVFEASSLQPE